MTNQNVTTSEIWPVTQFATQKINSYNEGIAATVGAEIPEITSALNQ
jgi:hypothetical protein